MAFVIEDNVIKTEDVNFDFTKLGGLGNIFFNSMKKNASKIAQIDSETGRKDTYEYLLRQSIRTAMMMKQKGIQKKDIVMCCFDNRLDAYLPFIGALFLGAIPCSIDPDLTPLEMNDLMTHVNPTMIVVIPRYFKYIKKVCQGLNLDTEIVLFETSNKIESFLEKQENEDEFKPVVSLDPNETAVIYFSSGTSGLAKVCCLNHKYFIKQSHHLMPPKTCPELLDWDRVKFELSKFTSGPIFLYFSPLYWITGGRFLIEGIISGSTRVLCTNFDPKHFWNIIEQYKINITLMSPFQVLKLTEHGLPPNVKVDSLVKVLTGGTPLPKKPWKKLRDMLPNTDVIQCYGTTETGSVTNLDSYNKQHRKYHEEHPNCLGFPIKGIWYKVVDPDSGAILGPNQEGELMIKSEFFMNGYHNQSTKCLYDSNGWFKTGDIVYYTDNCGFFVTDRLKEVIRYRQMTLYPYVIEEQLLKHPAVAQAVALGIPHEEDGDRPAAFVVLHENSNYVDAEEIRKFVDEKMQDKAKLRGGVRIVKSLPINCTGKIKRVELRRMVQEENN